MNATADRHDLSPPADTRWGRPLTLALVAHGLLVAALTWGVRWQSDTVAPAVEAELWSRLPQEAAPRAVEPPPPPPAPAPSPAPEPPRPAPAPDPGPSQAEIALQQAKKKAEEQKRLQAQREAEAKKKAEEKKLAEEKAKRERDKALAEEKKRDEAKRLAEEKRREAQLAADRQKNLERMMGQAGASGGPTARGAAQQSSGPSASYAGRVVARIKPNIVFTDGISGNPRAEVEVRLLPDGSIASSKLAQSSGNKAWDDAVLRAVERTGSLPRDENGRVPASLVIGFRPND